MSEYDGVTREDKIFAKKIIAAFFNDSFAQQITVNENVIEVVGDMLNASADCSEWMEYVPKPIAPIGPKPGIKWALRQIRKVGEALVSNPSSKHNFICKSQFSAVYRTPLVNASMGL